MFIILLLLISLTLFCLYLKWIYSFWSRNQVLGPKPQYFIGNIGPQLMFNKNWGVFVADLYNEYPNEPYIGYYKLMQTAVIPRDLNLIKDIMTKNFDCFEDTDAAISKKWDPLVAANPFFVTGNEWREARKTIIPAFTVSKLKNIFPIMNGVGEELVKYVKSFKSDNNEFDAKDLSLRFTTQNVIKCTFSIDPKCFDRKIESEFMEMGREMFAPSLLVGIKSLIVLFAPKWAVDFIPFGFVSPKIDKFFRHLVDTNKASRSNGNQSCDIFQMLIQLQEKHGLNDKTFLAGHAMVLFADGTETSSTALSFALYDLASNSECQQKLYEEIIEKLEKNNGKWNVDAVQEMIYLQCVLYESMRLHPPATISHRRCTKEYRLPRNKRQTEGVLIKPGTVVQIPIYAIHMDPNYYPNPEQFNPNRFRSEENRTKGSYLTFGDGPRTCIGMRFALAQTKVALAYIVKNFHIKLSPNHKPIVINPQSFLLYPKDGILVQFEAR